MSDWSDTSDSNASDASDVMPKFTKLWDEKAEKKKAATWSSKREKPPIGMWYYNLSAKERRAENERIAHELAGKEAELREVEKFEITCAPLEYRTRGSSLSPRTPPPREAVVTLASIPSSPEPSTSKAPEPPRKVEPQRRVRFRLASGSIVSSSDDEDVNASRPSPPMTVSGYIVSSSDDEDVNASRPSPPMIVSGSIVSSSDDEDVNASRPSPPMIVSGSGDDAESPPSVLTGDIAESSSGTDDSGAAASGRAVMVSKGREATGASLHSVQEEDVDRESTSSDAEHASSFLTKADVIRKRRERIEKRLKLLEEISYSHRRFSDESSRSQRTSRRPSVIMPKSRRISGRYTPAPKTVSTSAARATSSTKPGSDSEDPLAGLEKGQLTPSFSLSSAASSFADAPERSARTHVRVWHSTPHSMPKKAIPLPDIRVAHAPPPRGIIFAKAASANWSQLSGRRREVLERGEVLVLTKSPEQEFAVAGRSFHGAQLPMKPPSAAPGQVPQAAASISGPPLASGRHDESSISQKSVDAAERSTLIRIGIGDNHERVLSSNASSVSSAIVSFCAAKRRSRTSPAGHQLHSDQAEEAPAADVDVQSVDLLKQLLNMCEQEAPVTFELALQLSEHDLKCDKLGEGCTADVYLLRRPSGEEIAVKVIPVGSERLLNGEMPMSLASVIAEAVMTRELSNLRFGQLNRTPTFIELKKVYCVQGAYDPVLIKSWNEYDLVWCSENCDPLLFEENQLFALLVFENGGKTLERFKGTIEQIESVLLQVACSMAAAEPELEFEHRDLHTDNVLVKSTEQDCIEFVLNGRKVLVRTAGVQASIIDYTFSRLRKGDNVVYTDPSGDAELFKGSGSRQFDIYRIMRDENGNDWEAYHPHSNVLWLHYLLQKLLDKLPTTKLAVKAKGLSTGRGRMVAWADAILALQSAEEFAAQHVLPHLERDAEAHHKRRRSAGLQTKKRHDRKVRAWR